MPWLGAQTRCNTSAGDSAAKTAAFVAALDGSANWGIAILHTDRGQVQSDARPANGAHRHAALLPVLATEPERRLVAIVDFTLNLGVGRLQTSTHRRRVNQRDWNGAVRELRRWVFGGDKTLPGLVATRAAERLLLS